jgi:two-component system alkaline phosphatase synthesis response regulator PhoP
MSTRAFCRLCRSVQPLEEVGEGDQAKFWCETCGYPVVTGDAKQGAIPRRPPTILCIDDDPLVLSVCYDALAEQGYRVLTAADGPAGIEKAKKERPDLILLDILMPGMNGLEACRGLRAEPTLAGTLIVLLTSLKDPKLAARGRQAGAAFTMRKPLGPGLIVSSVGQILGRKPRPRPL